MSQRTEALRRSDLVKRFTLQCCLRVADADGAIAYRYGSATAYLDDLNEGDSLQLLLALSGAASASADVQLRWNGGELQTAALSASEFEQAEFVVSLPAEAGTFPFEVFVGGVKFKEDTAEILPSGGHRPRAVRSESTRTASASANGFMGPVYVKITVTDSNTLSSIVIGDHRFEEILGSKVLEESYQQQFIGKSLPLGPNDVDACAGATITSAAVVEAVNAAFASLP